MVNLLRRPSGWLLAAAILFGGALHARSAASPATPAASRRRPRHPARASASSQPVATDDEVKARCTACHKLPPPDILPRSAWRDEMVRMMLIQEGVPEPAGATSFLPLSPDWLRLWRYYDAQGAGEAAGARALAGRRAASRCPFEKRAVPGAAASGAIAIANVRLFDVDGDKRLDILASEMRTGPVLLGLAKDAHALKPIARLNHPAHIEPVDLDKDGRGDFLVADLGSFQPADHSDGAVYWLRGRADGSYVTVRAGDQAAAHRRTPAPPTSTATATST